METLTKLEDLYPNNVEEYDLICSLGASYE